MAHPGPAYEIPRSLYTNNRKRLHERFAGEKDGVLLFRGGSLQTVYDTDIELIFRQESTFEWMFGVTEPDCYGAVALATGKATVFSPKPTASHGLFFGEEPTLSEKKNIFEVDECLFTEDLTSYMQAHGGKVYTLDGVHSDGRKPTLKVEGDHPCLEGRTIDDTQRLYCEVCEVRMVKTEQEVALMRWINKVASDGHKEMLSKIKPGWFEYQAESVFKHYCAMRGCRSVAYTPICAAGANGARLHYPHNNRRSEDGDMMLMDMGCEYRGYASDITTSFPVNGTFNDKQRLVYKIVLAAFDAVHAQAKDGVSWLDMHMLALRVLAQGLVAKGFVTCSVEEAMEKKIPSVFCPHGLGHFIGKDTHDVGGYLKGQVRPASTEAQYLRTSAVLATGNIVTIEPGCYFIDAFLDTALADASMGPCLNKDKIQAFRGFGGVRLESNVVVTATGVDCLTVVPRTVADIEAHMLPK